ncbi:hypothetical protein HXX76_008789 [Chlamydomonas incerta]|uniref:GIY-YIG domain-containing protein n=1 Tax=Chlamydomonas incerta TaxID=51695 RepID=A0A835SSP7_CHLIN|nr:hypothetical protein HXX76_008789 [Chlamydomonas incerta]|eukprot:KAG2432443.1 hypothetical protein HXX76_008789 [Chlamydomonas incerta]
MRPAAAMSIFEQHCSPQLRWILNKAMDIARKEEEACSTAGPRDAHSTAPWMTSAHLALAALAAGYHWDRHARLTNADLAELRCCFEVCWFLHHIAHLRLGDCVTLLSDLAVEERRAASQQSRAHAPVHSMRRGAQGCSRYLLERSTPATLHLIMQSYRWALFTGCSTVQPCHLLWALVADTRVSYSPLRTDPLDEGVAAAAVREPPLAWLLQQAPSETAAERGGTEQPEQQQECAAQQHARQRRQRLVATSLCWIVFPEAELAFAALGYQPPPMQPHDRPEGTVQGSSSNPLGLVGAFAPAEATSDAVQSWCAHDVALRFCAGTGHSRLGWLTSRRAPPPDLLSWERMAALDAPAQQALLAVADSLQAEGVSNHRTWLVPFVGRCVALHRQAVEAAEAAGEAGAAGETGNAGEADMTETTEVAPSAPGCGAGGQPRAPPLPTQRQRQHADLTAQRRCLLAFLASPAGTWLMRNGLCRIEDFCHISARRSARSTSSVRRSARRSARSSMTIAEVAQVLREAVPLQTRAWLLRDLFAAWSGTVSSGGGQDGGRPAIKEAWIAAVRASMETQLETRRRSGRSASPAGAATARALWRQQPQQDRPSQTVELRGSVVELPAGTLQTLDADRSAWLFWLPPAEQDKKLAERLATLRWQPLSSATPPPWPGVYWLGIRPDDASGGEKVVPLYHGTSRDLKKRVGAHERRLCASKSRGSTTTPLYWGLQLASVAGTVVVAFESMPTVKEAAAAEVAELHRHDYAFNSVNNGAPRVRQALLAVGFTDEELRALASKQQPVSPLAPPDTKQTS